MLPTDIRKLVMAQVAEFSIVVINDALAGDSKSMAHNMGVFADFICKGFELSILEGKDMATKPSAN